MCFYHFFMLELIRSSRKDDPTKIILKLQHGITLRAKDLGSEYFFRCLIDRSSQVVLFTYTSPLGRSRGLRIQFHSSVSGVSVKDMINA